jgi:predicted RNA-binding protein associated with RNAse of E/G family
VSDKDVSELLMALRSGGMTLDEVAERFRHRSWPDERLPAPRTYQELASAALQDPEPEVPGSFDDVVAAYDRGEITRDQYRTLVEAAAESIRAEYDGGRNHSELGSAE